MREKGGKRLGSGGCKGRKEGSEGPVQYITPFASLTEASNRQRPGH